MSLYAAVKACVPESVQRFTRPMQSWQPGVTPLSTWPVVLGMSVLYLTVVLGGQELMRNRNPVPNKYLKIPFLVHNVLLSFGSGLLLALMLEDVLPFMWAHGPHDSICQLEVTTERMQLFYIINYYFKYWELLDTVFLVLKKKKLLFLHVYHHMATAALCYTQIVGKTPMAWSIISLNLAVHIVMYAYYALTSIGIRCPWKKFITIFQITQFVLDLYICYWGTWNHYVYLYFPWLPYYRYCYGETFAAWTGISILSSYLLLFIGFFKTTYKKPKAAAPAKKTN
ncbi:very-long-chain 3-oxoacyl-CoA synthase [Malassezia brasiliensis]|uniref:Elongation of fatty acids protein n=1 Tax=Malassezia brasiliensis TaxID=1821822 RepID=A0AAF0DSP0_9BASI|nr:very-long-chain 3-oxoacyl-CoA synthase [Malassezia brasiliensis]